MTTYRKTKNGQWVLAGEVLHKFYPVETFVTAEDIENIIVDALEAQSNYWCGIDNTGEEWDKKPKGMPVAQFATQLILEGKSIVLYDIEDENETWALKLENLLSGIGQAKAANYDIEDDADVVLQYALFDGLVYG